jgi:hypothetical protein
MKPSDDARAALMHGLVTVSYKDAEGITDTVEVTASSRYEAAVLGMKAFEQSEWEDTPWAAWRLR